MSNVANMATQRLDHRAATLADGGHALHLAQYFSMSLAILSKIE
jgi:hypothetical protein